MKRHLSFVLDKDLRCSLRRPVGLLSFVALIFLFVNSAVLAQISKEERCRDNKKLLAELEEKARTLQNELSYTSSIEAQMRDWLSAVNKAIADPEKEESKQFVRSFFLTTSQRRQAVESLGLPWDDKYNDEDEALLRALRGGLIRRIERINYVLKNKAEIKGEKASVDRQIAYRQSRVTEFCNESSGSKFVWERVEDGDCPGKDVDSSVGSIPDNTKAREGYTAVCWDGTGYSNNNNPGKAFCTYKDIPPEQCSGGKNTGVMYRARQ